MLALRFLAASSLGLVFAACSTSHDLSDAGTGDAAVDPDTLLAACLEDLPERMDTRVHRFRSEDGRFEIALVSAAPADYCADGGEFCVCNGGSCYGYELLRFGVVDGDQGTCVSDLGDLAYAGGHHSWGEVASATGAESRYVVRMTFSFDTNTYTDSLELRDPETDALVGAPFPLVSEDCYAIPAGVNQGCCERCQTRERSDD